MRSPAFRILSLDGGGIRGALTAAFLARIEQKLGTSISKFFDLYAGTSTGGIIATALAMGESAERIATLYRDRGKGIFERAHSSRVRPMARLAFRLIQNRLGGIDFDWLMAPKYESAPLEAALLEIFGARTLEVAIQRLIVPAVDLSKGQPVVLKTPHLPGLDRDRHRRAVDVIMATAAAPTYFRPASIDDGAYCDGGVWANNPAAIAIGEALTIARRCTRGDVDPVFEQADIRVLSIGTGRPRYFVKPSQDTGLAFWANKLVDVTGGAQSQGARFLAEYLIGAEQIHRIDFDLPNPPWRLDAVAHLPEMLHLGQETADAELNNLKYLFAEEARPYCPFPPPLAQDMTR